MREGIPETTARRLISPRATMQSISTFFRRKWAWAGQKKLFWLNIALLSITVSVIFIWPGPMISGTPSDLRIRLWGMTLQLLGAYTVWHDLTGTARAFGQGGILSGTWQWLKAGFGRQRIVLAVGNATLSGVTGSARMRQRPGIKSDASVEERIAVLERYVGYVDADIDGAFRDIRRAEDALSNKIKTHAAELSTQIRSTEKRLKDAMTGNYSVLLFGVTWLFVGIVLASVAAEISKLVAGQYRIVWAAL